MHSGEITSDTLPLQRGTRLWMLLARLIRPVLYRNWQSVVKRSETTFEFHFFQWIEWGYGKTLWNTFGSWVSGTSIEFFFILFFIFFQNACSCYSGAEFKICICPCFYFTNPKLFSLPMHCGPNHCVFWIVWIFILAFLKVCYLYDLGCLVACILIVKKNK